MRTLVNSNGVGTPIHLTPDRTGALFDPNFPPLDLTCRELSFYPLVIWEVIHRFAYTIRALRAGSTAQLHKEEFATELALARVHNQCARRFHACVTMGNGHFLMCNGRSVFVVHVGDRVTFLREVECIGAGLRALELRAYGMGYAFLTEALTEFLHAVPTEPDTLEATSIEAKGIASPLSRTHVVRGVVTCAASPNGLLATLSCDDGGARSSYARLHLITRSIVFNADARYGIDWRPIHEIYIPLAPELRSTVSLAFHGSQLIAAACHDAQDGDGTPVSHLEVFLFDVSPSGHMSPCGALKVVVPGANKDRFFAHRTTLYRAEGNVGLILTCTCFPARFLYRLE